MKKLSLLLLFVLIGVASFSFTKKPARRTSLSVVSRALVYPVAGRSHIEDKWGASRAGGIRRHKGIDIHARRGTPVVAVCDGVIVEKARTPIGGKTLWLQSATHGFTAYYAHLDKQLVREGQRVRKGQMIGTVGNTGNARSTPPHLHYGIERSGNWVNPYPYVQHAKKIAPPEKVVGKKAVAKKKSTGKKRTR